MANEINHAATAAELLEMADTHGAWLDEAASPQDQFYVSQLNAAALAHAVLALVEEQQVANEHRG